MSAADEWYRLADEAGVDSPALVVYPERIERNIEEMLRIAGGPARLRPHVKTHKMEEVVDLQIARGIRRFKCATIAEAEMLARRSARDVLLALQPVGPKVERLLALARDYPGTRFSTVVDSEAAVAALSAAFAAAGRTLPVLVDLDVGMHRTGIAPADALALYRRLARAPGLEPGGLHAYDGHVRDRDAEARRVACDACWQPVESLSDAIRAEGLPLPSVVAGGSPTFAIHARARPEVELSPGTTLLWDRGYTLACPELGFLPAAALLARVISVPRPGTACLDLGTKALASEMPEPRAWFPQLGEAALLGHSEEHMLLSAPGLEVGRVLYAIPSHICPTVALHSEVVVAEGGRRTGTWKVIARDRRLSV